MALILNLFHKVLETQFDERVLGGPEPEMAGLSTVKKPGAPVWNSVILFCIFSNHGCPTIYQGENRGQEEKKAVNAKIVIC